MIILIPECSIQNIRLSALLSVTFHWIASQSTQSLTQCYHTLFVAYPPYGTYTSSMITVVNALGKASVDGSVSVQAMAELTSISPEVGSIYGDLQLRIDGTGFNADSATVMVRACSFTAIAITK